MYKFKISRPKYLFLWCLFLTINMFKMGYIEMRGFFYLGILLKCARSPHFILLLSIPKFILTNKGKNILTHLCNRSNKDTSKRHFQEKRSLKIQKCSPPFVKLVDLKVSLELMEKKLSYPFTRILLIKGLNLWHYEALLERTIYLNYLLSDFVFSKHFWHWSNCSFVMMLF